jgi:PAS domain-containing protein
VEVSAASFSASHPPADRLPELCHCPVTEALLPRFRERSLAALRQRKPFAVEARVRRADGEWRWVAACGRPRFGEAEEYLGHVGVAVDITDRKRAEESLRLSEQNLRVSVAHAAIGFVRTTPQGRILEANPAYDVHLAKPPDIGELERQLA